MLAVAADAAEALFRVVDAAYETRHARIAPTSNIPEIKPKWTCSNSAQERETGAARA
jgi:hypothetical protein